MLEFLFENESVLVLESLDVIPKRHIREGFVFQYPKLGSALAEIARKKKGRRFRQPS